MYITKHEFADMVKDGSIMGKTVTTKAEEEAHPVIYEFIRENNGTLYYFLTNENIKKRDGTTFNRTEFSYPEDSFISETLRDEEANLYIKIEGLKHDWEV